MARSVDSANVRSMTAQGSAGAIFGEPVRLRRGWLHSAVLPRQQLFSFLGWIWRLQPVTPGTLAAETGLPPTTIRDYVRWHQDGRPIVLDVDAS